jgi:hypothetical protein
MIADSRSWGLGFGSWLGNLGCFAFFVGKFRFLHFSEVEVLDLGSLDLVEKTGWFTFSWANSVFCTFRRWWLWVLGHWAWLGIWLLCFLVGKIRFLHFSVVEDLRIGDLGMAREFGLFCFLVGKLRILHIWGFRVLKDRLMMFVAVD